MTVTRPKRVAVIGGGISGLSVAHELAKADLSVTVFERRGVVGGKASSDQKDGLPAEHGFRFFPGFYCHVIETMAEIPAANGHGCVADHLIELAETVIADEHGNWMTMPLPTGSSRPTARQRLDGVKPFKGSIPGPWELACIIGMLARLATTSHRRWNRQLEHESWLQLANSRYRPRQRSGKFERLFAIGLTRSFVATRAEEMSARTGGKILLQLLYDTYFGPPTRRATDRALNGPTTKVWIDPWHRYLEVERNVHFALNHSITELETANGEVVAIKGCKTGPDDDGTLVNLPNTEFRTDGMDDGTENGKFDFYVLAIPCEVLKRVLAGSPGILQLDEDLGKVFNLKTRWMNGIVIGLPEALHPPLPRGHVLCLDSSWALTVVDQTQLWSEEHLAPLRGRWQTLLSIDISDWESPGADGLPAKWPPQSQQIFAEVWRQLGEHLPQLRDRPLPADYNLDSDIRYPAGGADSPIALKRTNDEPLLVNTTSSWKNRPRANTRLPNLFVAGDFPRTHTNFASMEAANEAARNAVYHLLTAAGIPAECTVHKLEDPDVPWFSAPQRVARRVDDWIVRLGLPLRQPFRLPIAAWLALGLAEKLKGRRVGSTAPPE